ncbi:MAG: TetR/AcrR family transcriptional regulator [Gammaproteobacteria bacterium]|nr:TetR/AcrR family transcriptional regulator [Gammaproteobacteria bacterium]
MSPVAGKKNTRQRLIDTALELLWRNSYGSVSVDDICAASNVRKGSFYHYFPSKMDLTLAAMEADSVIAKELHDRIFSASIDPVKRFELLAKATYEIQAEAAEKYGHVCGCPCTSLASEMAGQSETIRLKFEEISAIRKRYFESAIRDLIAEGVLPASTDAKAKAQELYTYLSGEIVLARINNDLTSLKDSLQEGIKRTLGIRKEAIDE